MKKTTIAAMAALVLSVAAHGEQLVMQPLPYKNPHTEINHAWSIDLDQKPGKEYVVASGFEDGIDYSVYRALGKESSLLFRFHPVLVDSANAMKPYYWGYPWDIKNIVAKRVNGVTKILCSFDHDIEREGEIDIPKWQKRLPVVFFTGTTTQPDIGVARVGKQVWLTLDDIAKGARMAGEPAR